MPHAQSAGPVVGARETISHVWHNRRGEAFRIVGWPSPKPSKTAVILHHGLGEHAGRYETLARALGDAPFSLWGFDARGHGLTQGDRGDADGLGQLAEDFEVILPELIARSGAERVVVLGHSMGAAAVLWYLVSRQLHPAISAVMLSAPPVAVERTLPLRIKLAAARVGRKVAPRLSLASGLDSSSISSLPAEVERYLADPMVHDRISIRLAWSLLNDGPTIPDRASSVKLPVLLWHGADDRIALPEGSRQLARTLPDVHHVEIPGARHEVHHESPEVLASVVGRMTEFVARHTS